MSLSMSYHFLLPILFIGGLTAGTVDAIAGGGGLISLPILLSVGVPPHMALGTNKLQSTIGTIIATHSYYRQKWFSLKVVSKGLFFGFLGTILGAIASQTLSSDILKKIIPILLLAILIYSILCPKMGIKDRPSKVSEFWFYIILGFVMGFYDGFFGPGTGSLWMFLLTFLLGYNFIKATAYTKVFNLKSNIIATICFAFGQNIDYRLALYMAAGQIIGGKLGAHLVIKNGAKLIRSIFISVVSLSVVSLLYKNYAISKNLIFVMLLAMALVFSAVIIYYLKSKNFFPFRKISDSHSNMVQ